MPRWSSDRKHEAEQDAAPGFDSLFGPSVIEFSIRNFYVTITESGYVPG